MIRTVTDPPLCDIVGLWAESGAHKPLQVKAARLQAVRSETVGWYLYSPVQDCTKMIAAACLYPLDDPAEDLRELAFACLPEASAHIVPIIHSARLIAARFAQFEGLRIRALVRAGHRPGARLAVLAGFHRAAVEGGCERWEWRSDDAMAAASPVGRRRSA
jgi:hypothetical protein